jgi:hypothetical protein
MTDKVHWNITVFDQGFDAGSSMNVRSMMKKFGSFSVKFPKSNVSSLQKGMKKILHISPCVFATCLHTHIHMHSFIGLLNKP